MARLQYLTADAKEKIDAGRKVVGELETNIATAHQADRSGHRHGDQAGDRPRRPEAANRITRGRAGAHERCPAFRPAADHAGRSARHQATGAVNRRSRRGPRAARPHRGPESNGRYDVRYGGKTFQGYADHPRVAEPITSGPDVGKTSSAAGRYQFIGSTWDQQAKKLGLKDFSPEPGRRRVGSGADRIQGQNRPRPADVLKSGDQAAISDVPRQLSGQWSSLPGGRQPAGGIAPAANGGPGFTAADLQRNPFLGSAYVRTMAADESLRIQSATQAAAGIGKASTTACCRARRTSRWSTRPQRNIRRSSARPRKP
jgi:muramidase (phage lysozyme)